MARTFVSASNQYLSTSSPPVTAVPLTMACWYKLTSIGSDNILMSLQNTGATQEIWLGQYGSSFLRAVQQGTGGVGYEGVNASGVGTGTWHHAAAVFPATNVRHAYLDGVTAANQVQAGTVTPSGINSLSIGVTLLSAGGRYGQLNGTVAEAGVWNVVLSTDEIAFMAKGGSPLFIRPSNLVFYAPVRGRSSPEPEYRRGANLSLTGTPTFSDHPRIFYPNGMRGNS
jgi:hypothetical protein